MLAPTSVLLFSSAQNAFTPWTVAVSKQKALSENQLHMPGFPKVRPLFSSVRSIRKDFLKKSFLIAPEPGHGLEVPLTHLLQIMGGLMKSKACYEWFSPKPFCLSSSLSPGSCVHRMVLLKSVRRANWISLGRQGISAGWMFGTPSPCKHPGEMRKDFFENLSELAGPRKCPVCLRKSKARSRIKAKAFCAKSWQDVGPGVPGDGQKAKLPSLNTWISRPSRVVPTMDMSAVPTIKSTWVIE